jgi:hypothetical protein
MIGIEQIDSAIQESAPASFSIGRGPKSDLPALLMGLLDDSGKLDFFIFGQGTFTVPLKVL